MPEVLGPRTIADLGLPTGVDGGVIARWQMRNGQTYEQFVNEVALALGSLNAELRTEIGPVASITEEIFMEYPDGGSVTPMPEITDLDDPDARHGTTLAHMLPFKSYGDAVGGSWMYWRDKRQAQVDSDLATIIRSARWRFTTAWMTRLFTNTENLIGSAGYDVPMVRGTGGQIDYTPPAYAGEVFTTSHDHFIGVDSGSKNLSHLLNELAETVEEHGHQAPFHAIVSKADVGTYSTLPKFKEFIGTRAIVIDRGGATSGAEYKITGEPVVSGGVFGYFQSDFGEIELHSTPRITTGYASVYKSHGDNDPRNPLACRVHPDVGFGAYIVPQRSGNDKWPVSKLTVVLEMGFGVGMDRTASAVGRLVSGGAWTNPTIS